MAQRRLTEREIKRQAEYDFLVKVTRHMIRQYAGEFYCGVDVAVKNDVYASYCKYRGGRLAKEDPQRKWRVTAIYIQYGTDAIAETFEEGWFEYAKGGYYLNGDRPDGYEGLYYFAAHEFAHALHMARGGNGLRNRVGHPRQYWEVLNEIHVLLPVDEMVEKFAPTGAAVRQAREAVAVTEQPQGLAQTRLNKRLCWDVVQVDEDGNAVKTVKRMVEYGVAVMEALGDPSLDYRRSFA